MYGAGSDSESHSRKPDGAHKWVEFDKSPDTEKTLLEASNAPCAEKDVSENVRALLIVKFSFIKLLKITYQSKSFFWAFFSLFYCLQYTHRS